MHLSYNLIKNDSSVISDKRIITTEYIKVNSQSGDNTSKFARNKTEHDEMIRSYESIGSNIIRNAREESERILVAAADKATSMEREGYEKGYDQGKINGYDDGYSLGKENAIIETNEKVKEAIREAEKTLKDARGEYLEYLDSKKKEIINLALQMAKIILKKEIVEGNGLIQLLEDVLESSKGEDNIIIKVNKIHGDALRDKVNQWKTSLNIQGEIFILEVPDMEAGNAIVERSSGKDILGLNIAIESIEGVLYDRH